jgi:hypothetical protein
VLWIERLPMHPKGAFRGLRSALRLAAIATVSVALLVPASAQFWSPFGGRSQPRPSQQGGGFNPFGGFFGGPPPQNPAPPADYSRAPAPPQRKVDAAAATTNLVVVGDSMADWLAYGLEEAFAETPEMAIVRKHRTTAGLIRYDTRRDVEWPQVVKEIIAADKPKVLVMMIGTHDRQAIRERTPPPAPGRNAGAAKQQQQQQQQQSVTAPPPPPAPVDPELQAPQPGERQNAELPETPAEDPAPEPARSAPGNAGPFEFRSERWEAAYIRRIDATIAALKSAGVPVFWVGLPPQRATRATADSTYLNELYRQRAEKAGIVYVDIWEGFVDSSGQFAAQGPDFEGQIRRLRSGDGVYFTKPGARKLAHYVEREIQRTLANRTTPVALPSTIEPALTPGGRPGGPAQRPLVGPVVPLTTLATGQNELLGGGPARPATGSDPVATRVLTKGEAIAAPSGRADDFSWPRGSAASDPSLADTSPMPAVLATPEQAVPPSQATTRQNAPGTSGQPKGQSAPVVGSKTGEPKQPIQKRAPPAPSFFDAFPRPPGAIRPSASTQGAVR